LARVDPLTQLANRRWFDERLEAEWENSRKEGKNLTLLMIDIDFFKNFNDTYGHIAGDECLQAIAAELKRCVRSGIDTVARYGGEEFVALLSETNLETGVRVANRMRKAVEELIIPNKASAAAEVVTVSIGVCSAAATDVSSIHQLVGKADKALYKAKENGRNRVELDCQG
ncbi:MAG TPA: GGDEF domain-containing protein, partial [Clostridia bacterium]|nr:GGDEF domain-containing protein [Clostridia bacterium]